MKVALGSDHAGLSLKEHVKRLLLEWGHQVQDFGTDSTEPVDYPDVVVPAARAVTRGEAERGIVFGGSGNGEAMAANKVAGIRAALCHDVTTARLARQHNDANVLALGARITGTEVAADLVRVFLETGFDGGRHARRLEKLRALEQRADEARARRGEGGPR
ncbi:MAG: ribose 5-phosphate isomerase B [bacterium]